ncbi:type II toxin-antitoxin system death-on-curing family toxin [Stappia sp. F7233]|uniref:Type II toxin-antitoxin system death-on-curing family toxin n=1 Tax=Stappia albiluteola TaxID=2758565 RepID=A0A839AEF7_9HYPH|nr:type II toxin-antitoxin system death-on-curing family toxin [Stappia albiluteola]MBA5777951.1 type II toxin-antitoxin system death-on-curing family toxin [Stappia albiluteola]
MDEPVWLELADLDRLAKVVGELFPRHSVTPYPAKRNDLAGGVARARNKWLYDRQDDMTVLAAEYAFGIGKAHAFVDGNKRIAFLAAVTFLELNGIGLREPESGFFAEPIENLVSGRITTEELASHLERHAEWIGQD